MPEDGCQISEGAEKRKAARFRAAL